jgi:hypothetical protein
MNDYIIELKFEKVTVGVSAETKEDAIIQVRSYLTENMNEDMFVIKEVANFKPIFYEKYESTFSSAQCGGKPKLLKERK